MKPQPLSSLCQAVGGELRSPPGSAPPLIASLCTDTRQMRPGSLFVALKGENHDGHDHLAAAAAGGAVAALVQRLPQPPVPGLHWIVAPDTRRALGDLAAFLRRQLRGTVIAVAGSNGKTGTKYLIQSVLSGHLKGSMSPKSFNNDIGVPLAIAPADPADDYLILELGTNHHGEIRRLTEIARPDIAVLTNCGAEHLEGLTDLAGVIAENASILQGMTDQSLLIVQGDQPEVLEAVKPFAGRKITFGLNPGNDLVAERIRCRREGVDFVLTDGRGELALSVPLLGAHNAVNALAAVAVARHLGLSDAAIAAALRQAQAPDMRLQVVELPLKAGGRATLLNDAYNANPSSMQAALATLADLSAHRRIAVLGDMRELGPHSEPYHRQIGRRAKELGLDLLVCVGREAAWIAQAARTAGMTADAVHHTADVAEAATILKARLREDDLVLLKASRSVRLERLVEALRA